MLLGLPTAPASILCLPWRHTYNESRHRAISWTSGIDIAQWFATRYGEHGTIWRANVKKQWVLALLEGKEHEILIDIPKGMPVMNIDPCDPDWDIMRKE